ALVFDTVAPGADLHEPFQVPQASEDTARRTRDHQPHAEDEEHLKDGSTKVGNVRLISQDQRRQAHQLIKHADRYNGEKTDALIHEHLRWLLLFLHRPSSPETFSEMAGRKRRGPALYCRIENVFRIFTMGPH